MTKKQNAKRIAFIGAGNMSRSIIGGLIEQNYPADKIIASNPSSPKLVQLGIDFGIDAHLDNLVAARQADVIVLGVKPQMMSMVCDQLSCLGEKLKDKLVISLAAGVPCKRLVELLDYPVSLIRCMPNTPSLYSKGMSGLYSHGADEDQCRIATDIMKAAGEVIWVDDEQQIDGVTAISGSGPAYFFLFMEAMVAKAKDLGFDEYTAKLLVQQTALGAATMVQNSDTDLTTLKDNVTSKGGTTAAALAVFEQQRLPGIVEDAIQAAADRAQQLSQDI